MTSLKYLDSKEGRVKRNQNKYNRRYLAKCFNPCERGEGIRWGFSKSFLQLMLASKGPQRKLSQIPMSPVLCVCEFPVLGEEPVSEGEFFLSVAPRVLIVFYQPTLNFYPLVNFSQVLLTIVIQHVLGKQVLMFLLSDFGLVGPVTSGFKNWGEFADWCSLLL